MQIDVVTLKQITFTYQDYPSSLYRSLKRIGLNFPILIRSDDDGFLCCDGHKRLSAIQDILREDPTFPKFQTIQVIIQDQARTAPPYHLHNHH